MAIVNKVPPYECVPWFKRNFDIEDKVKFWYDGGLGGVYEIEGKVSKIDPPIFSVNGRGYTMADIVRISKVN